MTGSGLSVLVADVLEVPPDTVSDDSAAVIGGWTSLQLLQIVRAVEDAYKIRLTPREIRGIRRVGDLRQCLMRRGVSS